MIPTRLDRRWAGPLLSAGLLVVAWVAIAFSGPPAAPRVEGAKTAFSVDRAWPHIEEVALGPHAVGTIEHERVRSYVLAKLQDLGLETDTLTTLSHARWGGTVRSALTRNVVARLAGSASTGAVLLMSHYDAVPLAPGAGDAAIGVAVVLETARALVSGERPRNDVVFLLTDAEELGLLGARAFAAEHPWVEQIAFVLNFEGRGTSGAAVMFETGPGSGWAVRELARRGRRPVSASILPEAYSRMPNDTDFTVFRSRGLPGLNFAIGGSAQWYHTPGDRPEHLSPASVQHMGDNALAMARRVGATDLGAVEGSERIFFFVPGVGLLGYGPGWAIPLAALLAVAFVGVTIYARRRGRLGWWGIPVGLVAAAATLAVSVLLAHWLWPLARDAHPEWGGIVGRAFHREWPYTLALAALAAAVVTAVFGLLRRWFSLEGLALGALLVPVAVAVASAFALTAGSYLLLWPSLLSLTMLALVAAGDVRTGPAGPVADGDGARVAPEREPGGRRGEVWRLAGVGAAAAGIVLVMVPVVHLVHVMLSVAVAPLLAAVVGALALLLLPALDLLSRPHRAWLPVAAVLAAAALAGLGVAGSRPTAGRPAPSNLLHVQDTGTGEAFWASPADHGDAFTDRFLGTATDTVTLADYSGALRVGRYRVAPAPGWPAEPATPEVLGDDARDGTRRVRIRLAWPDPPMLVEVRPAALGTRLLSPLPPASEPAAADPPSERWRLVRAGLGQPLEVVVEVPAGEPLDLVLTMHYPGLSPLIGARAQRPPGLMSVPAYRGSGTLSDVRLVREMLVF
jgi:hypothetical protein